MKEEDWKKEDGYLEGVEKQLLGILQGVLGKYSDTPEGSIIKINLSSAVEKVNGLRRGLLNKPNNEIKRR